MYEVCIESEGTYTTVYVGRSTNLRNRIGCHRCSSDEGVSSLIRQGFWEQVEGYDPRIRWAPTEWPTLAEALVLAARIEALGSVPRFNDPKDWPEP